MIGRRVYGAATIGRALGAVGWAAIATGFVAGMLHAGGLLLSVGQSVPMLMLSVFFIAQIIRLTIAAVVDRRRRLPLTLLLVAVVLWAAGGALFSGSSAPDLASLPAPRELPFLASYVAMAGYLISDVGRNLRRPLDGWLHVVVICGGTVCLTETVLLTPVAAAYDGSGLGELLALIYPLIDLVLAALVTVQTVMRLREGHCRTAALILGFLFLAFADGRFVNDIAATTYHLSATSDVAWGIGFALIVGSACQSSAKAARAVPRSQGSAETLGAAAIAVLVLALRPAHGLGIYLTVPAIITLLGAAGRLVLALREANGAAEAVVLARTDDLTRLPNRRALRAGMDVALASPQPLSLMLLDLDGFKEVNDTLGHAAGDKVLILMAHRIRTAVPPSVLVARLGGDEFAIMTDDANAVAMTAIARDLLAGLSEPVRIDGVEITPSASVGVATLEHGDVTSNELLRRADVAMYQAKKTHAGVLLYDPSYDDFSKTKLMLAEALRRALREGQLELWYQPQINSMTGQLCGLESLIRWRHPSQGVLSPATFLPAARSAGLMPDISAEVARQAVAAVVDWRAKGLTVRVAVNCAPPELLSGNFLPDLYEALDHVHLRPGALVVEVTEDCFFTEPERARQLICEIREHGLQVAIDDYGTGFSSLAYLRDLPMDELKIDQSFVAAMLTDSRSRMIISSTVQMAAALTMRTVAEGVEDAATAAALVSLGVDVLQGYHMARPMPAGEIMAWARRWSSLTANMGQPSSLHSATERTAGQTAEQWWGAKHRPTSALRLARS